MSITLMWSLRCIQRNKLFFLCKRHTHISRNNSQVMLSFPKRSYVQTSTRSFSWEGFYTSVSFSTPVLTLQNMLIDLHNISGLPWWTVIMLTTLGIRTFFVFPFAVHQNQVIARFTNLNAELGKMAPELNKEVNIAAKMYGWNETMAKKVFRKSMREYYQKFIIRDNCHPFKIVLLAIFQIPVWVCFSISLRNFTLFGADTLPGAHSLYEQLKTEGALWFTDLTLPDMFVIPILLATVNLLLIEIHALRQIAKGSKLQRIMLYVMRSLVILVAYAAALNPTTVSFYWLCSSSFGLAQSLLLMSPRFRHILRIPLTANESVTPFKDIASNFRKRFLS